MLQKNPLRSLHRLFRENVFSTKMAKFRAGTNTLLKKPAKRVLHLI